MGRYYEGNKLYVKNDDGLIYRIVSCDVIAESSYMIHRLELTCGYSQADCAYLSADAFDDDVQSEQVIQYFIKEGLEECLSANDYELIELPENIRAVTDGESND